MLTDEQKKYPTGKFNPPASYTAEDISAWLNDIRELPGKLKLSVAHMNDQRLDTPYRQDGWTIRQVVHHLADSHMNALLRFKWTLTEDDTVIKPYEQQQWALLPDYTLPVESSLKLLDGVHIHLAALIESLTDDELNRTYRYTSDGERIPLKRAIALYAWHGKHHLEHIRNTFE